MTVTTEETRQPNVDVDDPVVHKQSWARLNDPSKCNTVFKHMKGNITDGHWIEYDMKYVRDNAIEKKYANYYESIETVYGNTTFNVSGVDQHNECLAQEANYTFIDNLLILMFKLAVNVTNSDTYDEAYSYAVQIPPLYRQRLNYDKTKFREQQYDLQETCGWMRRYADETSKATDKFRRDFEKVKDERDAAVRQINNLKSYFSTLYHYVMEKVKPTIDMGMGYINKNLTKVELAEEFVTPYFTKAVQDIADINADIMGVTKDYIEEMEKGRDKLVGTYSALFELKLPVVNYYIIHKLHMINAAAQIKDSRFQELTEGLKTNLKDNLEEMVKEIYNRLINPTINFTVPVLGIIEQIENLAADLKAYKKSATMSTKFFM